MKIHWDKRGQGFLALMIAVVIVALVKCATSAELAPATAQLDQFSALPVCTLK